MSGAGEGERLVKGFVAYQLVLWFLLPVLALAVLLGFLFFGGGTGPVGPDPKAKAAEEEVNYLAQARTALSKQGDLTICRNAVQLLNAHLQRAALQGTKEPPVPALSTEAGQQMAGLLKLDKDDVPELTSATLTPLDAHHLETCLLLRDAARSLEVPPIDQAGKVTRQSPLDQAAAGFAWVCRQVRLTAPGDESILPPPLPPAQALRRGWGAPLDRAVAFLALLEQFGIEEDDATALQGCLVFIPGDKGEKRLWACGVTWGKQPDGVYLFDPRLGLPVPGPGGKGVATLKQAREDAGVLGQLKIDKLAYDVTPDLAKAATLELVCPLSAAAPRMRVVQDKLLRERTPALPVAVRVRLAEEPARVLAATRDVAKTSGLKPDDVLFWPQGATVLRRFLPKDDGGTDAGVGVDLRLLKGFARADNARAVQMSRQQVYRWEVVPWQEFPAGFRDADAFSFDNELGHRLRMFYGVSFFRQIAEPNAPREQALRGKFPAAMKELVDEQEQLSGMRQRLRQAGNLDAGLREWADRAIEVYAAVIQTRGKPQEAAAKKAAEAVFRWDPRDPIGVLMFGSIAGPRGAEVMALLAMCRYEQAVRAQARADLTKEAGIAAGSDAANAARAWTDAVSLWQAYLDENPGRPGVAQARRLQAEALLRAGKKDEAVKLWQDVSAPMGELEKLASLWLAKQAGS